MKNKTLKFLSMMGLVVVLVGVNIIPVSAARESCYTINTYSIGTCTFRDYVCYISDTVVWSPSGGSVPAFGVETRGGAWGTNGWGYDFYSGNSWGNQLAGCGLHY